MKHILDCWLCQLGVAALITAIVAAATLMCGCSFTVVHIEKREATPTPRPKLRIMDVDA